MSARGVSPTVAIDPTAPPMLRAVSRWQIVGLSINDVIGSGIYLLPAATFALLGAASVWAVLLAGLAVSLLVLCYAQAAKYFDQPGGGYLYAREAFGDFVGFEIGWMIWLTRIASAAALSNGLAYAMAHFWPAAAGGVWRVVIIVVSLGALTWINVVGVKSAARTGVVLVIAKLLPLALFIGWGVFYVDWTQGLSIGLPPLHNLGEAALLLLFAYAGFENIPAAAGEYRNPRRDVPFALLAMIAIVTAIYVAVQVVAQGTLPGLAASASPLADAAARFGGPVAALILTVGATVSILGTNSNTTMLGPRVLYALALDGFGPRIMARVHPRYRTPAVAIVTQGAFGLALALSGSFVQLALLSVVARLFTYLGTAAAVLVLQRRYAARGDADHSHIDGDHAGGSEVDGSDADRSGVAPLPGGWLIPGAAILLSCGLLASATLGNLIAAGIALLVGAAIYRFRRAPAA